MDKKHKDLDFDALLDAILVLENKKEAEDFFEDLCTIAELQSMGQRLRVAKLLNEGVTYVEIGEETGASAATISRVNRSLRHGSEGYKAVLSKLS